MTQKPSEAQIWGIGLLSVTIISLSAAAGIILIHTLSKRFYEQLLTFFVGLGVGSLCGSAIFHLLPHTFHLDEDGSKSYLENCWVAVGGIFLFFILDRTLKICAKYRENRSKAGKISSTVAETVTAEPAPDSTYLHNLSERDATAEVQKVNEAFPKQRSHSMCGHDHDVHLQECGAEKSVIKAVAWMIIFGDGLHNLVDGLSIGAAFASSIVSGISVSVAILCEEFPHELGDVAILVNSGMSLKQALICNILSASTCFIGFIVGVFLGALEAASVYIFALAGGMFLYISLTSMVPVMNESMEEKMDTDLTGGLRVMAVQTAGVATGLITLFLLAYYDSAILKIFTF